MSSFRIIRPRGSSGKVATGPVEVTMEQFRALSQGILDEARSSVREAEDRKHSVEAEISEKRQAAGEEIKALYRSAEADLDNRRRALDQEIEEARAAGFAQGEQAGFAAGAKNGQEEGFRKGFEEGYRDGRDQGYREARDDETKRLQAETGGLVEAIRSLAASLSAQRGELLQAARRDLIRLAVEVARKIVQREIRNSSALVIDNVRRAIEMVFARNKIIIQLHPEDVPVIRKHASQVFEFLGSFEDFELQEAGELSRGGCRILSGSGQVDLSLQAQFEIIQKALEEAVQGEEILAAPAEVGS
ncbi:MAG: hypothetical protein HY717_09740 [Planctomycetes bacterium]|nr:hypothetical protein [Planctomycetota bacterium]